MSISNNMTHGIIMHTKVYLINFLFTFFIWKKEKCHKYHFSKSSIDVMLRFLEFELMILIILIIMVIY